VVNPITAGGTVQARDLGCCQPAVVAVFLLDSEQPFQNPIL